MVSVCVCVCVLAHNLPWEISTKRFQLHDKEMSLDEASIQVEGVSEFHTSSCQGPRKKARCQGLDAQPAMFHRSGAPSWATEEIVMASWSNLASTRAYTNVPILKE